MLSGRGSSLLSAEKLGKQTGGGVNIGSRDFRGCGLSGNLLYRLYSFFTICSSLFPTHFDTLILRPRDFLTAEIRLTVATRLASLLPSATNNVNGS